MNDVLVALLTLKSRFFAEDERGATAVEYGLMVALIAAAIVTIVGTLGGQLNGLFTNVSNSL